MNSLMIFFIALIISACCACPQINKKCDIKCKLLRNSHAQENADK